jgi:hypothetical protein
MNRKVAEQVKAMELTFLHAKAQLRPNETRIRELESQISRTETGNEKMNRILVQLTDD